MLLCGKANRAVSVQALEALLKPLHGSLWFARSPDIPDVEPDRRA